MRECTGTLLTPATWIRKFVQSHPEYRKDSVVSQVINYDLLLAVDEMWVFIPIPGSPIINLFEKSERGVRGAADLLPEYYNGGNKNT